MNQRAQVYRSRVYSTLPRVCLFLLFALSHAVAASISLAVPIPGTRLIGSETLNLGAAGEIAPILIQDVGVPHDFTDPGGGGRLQLGAFTDKLLLDGVSIGPYLAAQVNIAPGFNGESKGTFVYGLAVDGPDGDVLVRIYAFGHAFTDPGGSGEADSNLFAKATWSIEDTVGGQTIYSDGISSGNTHGLFSEDFGDFGHPIHLTLTANHAYRVTMFADAAATAGHLGGEALAFADPVFAFEPGVSPDYSFRFSDGIVNMAPAASFSVPEPGTLSLLATSLLATVCLLRRYGDSRAKKR